MAEVITIILSLAFLVTSLPVGLLLAWLCKDELGKDRKYFYAVSGFLLICLALIGMFYKDMGSMAFSIAYMVIVFIIMALKSGNK